MKKKFIYTIPAFMLFFSQSVTVFAVTEADVEAVGREAAAGNIFIWFLCAIAFLKISQKIDSFMNSLGVNVGHTGGSMMAELLIAARGFTMAKSITGGSSFRGGSFRMGGGSNHMNSSIFLSGGRIMGTICQRERTLCKWQKTTRKVKLRSSPMPLPQQVPQGAR